MVNPYLVVSLDNNSVYPFTNSDDLMIWLWGRDITRFLIIKNESKLIKLEGGSVERILNEGQSNL